MLTVLTRTAIVALVLLFAAPACGTPQLTPSQQQAHSAALAQAEQSHLEAELARAAKAAAIAELAASLARAEELDASLAAAAAAPGGADADKVSALVSELQHVAGAVDLAQQAQLEAEAALQAARLAEQQAQDAAAAIETEAAEATASGLLSIVGNIFPPAKGLSDLWLLLAPLLWKRPRDRAADAVASAAGAVGSVLQLDLKGGLAGVLKSLRDLQAIGGLKHSTDDPLDLAGNLGKLAGKSADYTLEDMQEALTNAYRGRTLELGGDPAKPEPAAPAA